MKHPIALFALVVLALVVYWLIAPTFTTKEVHDAIPTLPAGAAHEARSSPVAGTPGHDASGSVRLITTPDGKTQLVYENFKTVNGPDLFVYLATDKNATEFISLGRLRGTEGTLVYDIPEGITLSEYPFALTWCKAFGVLFNSADLKPLIKTPSDALCIQVITPARNDETGEIQEFPTPCDVPDGWTTIENDVPTLDLDVNLEVQ